MQASWYDRPVTHAGQTRNVRSYDSTRYEITAEKDGRRFLVLYTARPRRRPRNQIRALTGELRWSLHPRDHPAIDAALKERFGILRSAGPIRRRAQPHHPAFSDRANVLTFDEVLLVVLPRHRLGPRTRADQRVRSTLLKPVTEELGDLGLAEGANSEFIDGKHEHIWPRLSE